MGVTNVHYAIPIMLVAATLPRTKAIFDHFKVGINMGTKRNAHSDCMVPELQLTRNLYVDYFDTTTTCFKPDGTQVYTFRNHQQSHGTGNFESVNAICFKLPKICHLLKHERGRSIMAVGQQVVDSLRNNMHSLYSMLTGKDSSLSQDKVMTSRFAMEHPRDIPSPTLNHIDCRYKSCHEHSIDLCESIEDVAFPVVGRSAITNTSVTILQEYPHRVQPIFFRKCRSYKSRVVYGRCIQKYLPVSVYIATTSEDKVLSQDFVMVESGCQVIADISYREWNAKVESRNEFSLPTNADDQWEKQINRTWLPANLSHTNLEPTFFEESVRGRGKTDVPLPEAEKRRISDRRLF
ncbi:uncharacterized protein [Palaemon carinicauda]|uniref:uncharacterized protein isoform X2 n=1 Tax=Palaemon carinicauda TaxID=392227 RepID=UPI0035B63BF8